MSPMMELYPRFSARLPASSRENYRLSIINAYARRHFARAEYRLINHVLRQQDGHGC